MCGIAGFVGGRPGLDEDSLAAMNAAITRRGPDDSGQVFESGVGLAMRRLSIVDLAGSHQPMTNEDGSVVVVFNGEIYNFRELRAALIGRGHRFQTEGDTEVLVHLYEEHGERLVDHLRGMFAFAIWDRQESTLLVARDRLGIKPLYYSLYEGTLLFGSEIKAILAAQVVPREISYQAIDAYMTLTYIPAPQTIYKAIRKLEPGHILIYRSGEFRNEQYWDVQMSAVRRAGVTSPTIDEVSEKLMDAVESHLVSDVPVGAFLSGGLDSSLVVGMMSRSTSLPVTTFTMGFEGTNLGIRDERPYARMLGDRYAVEYNEYSVRPDLAAIMDEILDAFDEPFADDSVVPTYYICKLTREHVKVALSGLGGDELFAGYHRYRGLHLSRYYDLVPMWVRAHIINPLVQRLPEPRGGGDHVDHMKRFSRESTLSADQRYLGYVSTMDVAGRKKLYSDRLRNRVDFDATGDIITKPFNRFPDRDIVDRATYTDLKTYLPGDILALSDRLSMWHSLELRVPLIDHELTEMAMRVPSSAKINSRHTKILLRTIAEDWLPPEILHHRKQGFESPMAAWLRSELADYARDTLFDENCKAHELFDMEEVRRLYDEHVSGRRKNNKILFSLLVLFGWFKKNIA